MWKVLCKPVNIRTPPAKKNFQPEVVLGAYRGELVSLDAKLGAGNEMNDAAASTNESTAGSGWDSAETPAETFDDEIPF